MPEAGTGNPSPALTTVSILLFLWALLGYLIRVYIKVWKGDGWHPDDGAITAATIAALAQLISMCYAIQQGYSETWPSQGSSANDNTPVAAPLYASQIFYIATIGLTRVSIGFFIAKVLARTRRSTATARTFAGLCGAWTVASLLAIALRGNFSEPWQTLNGSDSMWRRWIAIEATGFVLDLLAASIVALFVYDLQMSTSKKLTVCTILNCRLILGLPIGWRLYYLSPSLLQSRQISADMIAQVIVGTTIIFASITCLKPFLRPFDAVAFGSHASRTGLFVYTTHQDGTRKGGYELSAPHSANRTGNSRKDLSRVEQEDELPLTARPDTLGHLTSVRCGSSNSGAGGRNISKTQSWSVSVGGI